MEDNDQYDENNEDTMMAGMVVIMTTKVIGNENDVYDDHGDYGND